MTDTTRGTAEALFTRLAVDDVAGAAALFADDVDWDIPGATELVPWIGRRRSAAEVLDFYTRLDSEYLERDLFEVERIFVDRDEAVAAGHLRSTVRATGKVITSAFAIRLTVTGGRITRYRMLEDSYAVAEAVRGH